MNVNELFMQRCLDLAKQGFGNVAPNPMVGCVIVHGGKVIGEGYHKRFGEAHAEVNAIHSAIEESAVHLPESTLYVNLEPCSHEGKTPPCADLIISKKIPRVIIGITDPNPLVAGKGIQKLKDAGIHVTVGVLEKECRELNKRFLTHFEKKRPYIILKWAKTKDGFMATQDKHRKQISNELSRELVHKWRSEEQAILVGFNTALHDNPELNVRFWKGINPVRCVIDKKLQLPVTLNLFDKTILTIVFNSIKDEEQVNLHYVKLNFENDWLAAPVGVVTNRLLDKTPTTAYVETAKIDWLNELLTHLHHQNIQSLMVEGGPKTLQTFINKSLWDEARIFTSAEEWKDGIKSPELKVKASSSETIQNNELEIFHKDVMLTKEASAHLFGDSSLRSE